jgi:DNA-binding LacI/PurR family transcriptional regulator
MAAKTTIYDIAKEAGVAPSTVSRVLSGHQNVSVKTRIKVEAIARTHSVSTLQSLRHQVSLAQQTFAVIIPETSGQYWGRILSAANREAKRLGFQTMLFQLLDGDDYDLKEIAKRIIHWRLRGALYIGGVLEAERADLPVALNMIIEHMPLVAISPPLKNVKCTFLHNDLETVMFQAVQHLHMLGHHRIAFIGGNQTLEASGARAWGYLRAIEEFGLVKDDAYHGAAGFSPEMGEIAVLRMLTTLPRHRWPTAIIAFSDMVAVGAIHQLHSMGLKVPDDMALIGCDNNYFCPYTLPPLTTIDLFSEERARTAIAELVSNSQNQKAPVTLIRAPSLIIRESCGAKLGHRQLD